MTAAIRSLNGQRTLLLEDDDDLREILRLTLEDAGCQVIDVADGDLAHKLLMRSAFDLAVIDMMVPNRSGQDILELAKSFGTTLIAISGDPHLAAKDVYNRGAHVFVRKPFKLDDVVQAAVRHLGQAKVMPSRRVHLSDRELEILSLIYKGYETEQIAAILGISPNTVWHHRKTLKRKHSHMSFIEICTLYFNK